MRSLTLMTCLCLVASLPAMAQDYSGRYSLDTPSGPFRLELTQAANGALSGMLRGGGLEARVTGSVAMGVATGQMASIQGTSFFEARLAGDQLALTIVDPDPYGQPDLSTAGDRPRVNRG